MSVRDKLSRPLVSIRGYPPLMSWWAVVTAPAAVLLFLLLTATYHTRPGSPGGRGISTGHQLPVVVALIFAGLTLSIAMPIVWWGVRRTYHLLERTVFILAAAAKTLGWMFLILTALWSALCLVIVVIAAAYGLGHWRWTWPGPFSLAREPFARLEGHGDARTILFDAGFVIAMLPGVLVIIGLLRETFPSRVVWYIDDLDHQHMGTRDQADAARMRRAFRQPHKNTYRT